jgi:hypothetical protein
MLFNQKLDANLIESTKMRYKTRLNIIFSLMSLLPLVGCSQLPPELRNLQSVTITVTNSNSPIEGVTVSLVNKQPQTLRGCNGVTNASGVAKIATSVGSRSVWGVASGEYRIVLTRNVPFPEDLQPINDEESLPENERAKREKKRNDFLEKNNIIPEKLRSRSESPIELAVNNQSMELKVDIAKY